MLYVLPSCLDLNIVIKAERYDNLGINRMCAKHVIRTILLLNLTKLAFLDRNLHEQRVSGPHIIYYHTPTSQALFINTCF